MRSITELTHATASERDAALAAVPNFRSLLMAKLTQQGRRSRPTRSQYADLLESRTAHPCSACEGTGLTLPELRGAGGIHPSAADSCITRLYLDVVGDTPYMETVSPSLQLTFEIGHTIHRVFQGVLEEALHPHLQSEVGLSLPEALVEHGHADAVYDDGEVRCLLEFKTASGNSFAGINAPKAGHLLQASIYARALDCPALCFLYLNKEAPGTVRQFILLYEPSVYTSWLRNVIVPIEHALAKGVPPPRNVSESTCRSCGYEQACPYSSSTKLRRSFGGT